jgi:predicted metalloprotease
MNNKNKFLSKIMVGIFATVVVLTGCDSAYFKNTGHMLNEPFYSYWQAHGGERTFGLPISEGFVEDAGKGKKLFVQYFERAVFEYHEENQPPNQVLLRHLGRLGYATKYLFAPTPVQYENRTRGSYFPQTQHWLGGSFLTFWNGYGGLANFGYPVTGELSEKNPRDGRTYTVQYFERARFELHPEQLGTDFYVMLSLLGRDNLDLNYPGGSKQNIAIAPVPPPTSTPVRPKLPAGPDTDMDGVPNNRDECPGQREDHSRILPDDGCISDIRKLVLLASKDIRAYWTKVFQRWGKVYVPFPEPVRYWEPIPTACRRYTQRGNASYCGADNKIYYHVPWFEELVRNYGDFAPLAILGHEAGHGVAAQLGLSSNEELLNYISPFQPETEHVLMNSPMSSGRIFEELFGDCSSGAWAAGTGQYLVLDDYDLREARDALYDIGDDSPANNPEDHGSHEQREQAFMLGYGFGPDRCLAEYLGR